MLSISIVLYLRLTSRPARPAWLSAPARPSLSCCLQDCIVFTKYVSIYTEKEVSRCRNTDTGSCSTDSASARTGADRRPGHRVKLCVRLLAPGYLCVRGCSCQARVLVSLCSPVSAAAGLVSTVLQLLPSPATARPAPRTPLRGSKLIAATAAVARPDRRVTAAHGDNRGSLLQYLHLHVGQYAVAELREQCDPNLTWKQNDV